MAFPVESKVYAIRSVHEPLSSSGYLPVIKGETLIVIEHRKNSSLFVESKQFIRGLVSIEDIKAVDPYNDEDFYLFEITAKMAQNLLQGRENGTFLIRSNSRDADKIVISVNFKRVVHFSFPKRGAGLECDGVVYDTIPKFVKKCQEERILDGYLGRWIRESDLELPVMVQRNAVRLQQLNLRIVAGNLAVAVDSLYPSHPLCLKVVEGHLYTILRACRDPHRLVARDEHDNEGYVPSALLECYIPEWFHGKMEREEAKQLLNKTCRDGTFLLRERPTQPGMFAMSVWCPDGIVHVPLAYVHGQIATGVSRDLPVFDSLLDLVNHYIRQTMFWTITNECVRTLFPLSRKETSLPDEIQKMDLDSINIYLKALKEGKEHVRDIRLMVVGHHGAGKTTLTERLMGKPFMQVGSTNGIVIHVRQCKFNVKTGRWTQNQRPGSAFLDDETHALRLQRLLESPSEERISVLEDMKRQRSRLDSSSHNDSSLLSDGNTTLNDTVDINLNNKTGPTMHHDDSSDSISGLCDTSNDISAFSNNDTEDDENSGDTMNSYEIKMDRDIARYRFTEETLKVISTAFGKNRPDSAKNERSGFISMWDFAGQYIFYATHQVFLSARAVYLLVLDLSKNLDDFVEDEDFPVETTDIQGRQVKDYGELWLRSIHTFCGDAPGQPSVILVGTHRDLMNCRPEDREKASEKYFEDFRKLVEDSPISSHIEPEQFSIDNTWSQEQFDKLKETIVKVAKRQHFWNQEIPARWLPLERSLGKLRGKATMVSLSEVMEVNRSNEVAIEDPDEIHLFLRYQHAVGNLIYFDDKELAETVVLDPQWIIDAFKTLITATRFCKLRTQLRPLWAELQEKAVLREELVSEIWKVEKDGRFLPDLDKLLQYMEKLDIIARPKVALEDGTVFRKNFYLVPSLLRMKGKERLLQPPPGSIHSTPFLCFLFNEGFVPPAIFQRMLGACLAKYSVLCMGGEVQLFCNVGVFRLDTCHCFIFRMDGIVMKAKVLNLIEQKVQTSLCDKLRRFLTSLLEEELGRYQQNMPFTVCVECERTDRMSKDLINCRELLKVGRLPCCAHKDPHVVHSEKILQAWYPDYVEVTQGQSTLHSWVDDLPSHLKDRQVTLGDLSKVSKNLGFNWEFVPLELGLKQVDIDQSKMDYKYQTAMQIYDTLLKWKNMKRSEATIVELVKAIQRNSSVEVHWETVKNLADGIY